MKSSLKLMKFRQCYLLIIYLIGILEHFQVAKNKELQWEGRLKPRIFLMDEPLSNLDAQLRVEMRSQISILQKKLGVTTIYVTHDQVEAMTMGDRVAIINDGKLVQIDKPSNLYNKPINTFVASFIGSPKINFFDINHIIKFNNHSNKLNDYLKNYNNADLLLE